MKIMHIDTPLVDVTIMDDLGYQSVVKMDMLYILRELIKHELKQHTGFTPNA